MKTSRQYAKDIIQQCFTSAGMDESDVTDILDKMLTERHEATWAMALNRSAVKAMVMGDAKIHDALRAIPCPPLQTTNEESE